GASAVLDRHLRLRIYSALDCMRSERHRAPQELRMDVSSLGLLKRSGLIACHFGVPVDRSFCGVTHNLQNLHCSVWSSLRSGETQRFAATSKTSSSAMTASLD